jgi:hypothetical protein
MGRIETRQSRLQINDIKKGKLMTNFPEPLAAAPLLLELLAVNLQVYVQNQQI